MIDGQTLQLVRKPSLYYGVLDWLGMDEDLVVVDYYLLLTTRTLNVVVWFRHASGLNVQNVFVGSDHHNVRTV